MDSQSNSLVLYEQGGLWILKKLDPNGTTLWSNLVDVDTGQPSMIVDGSSNTILVGEKGGHCHVRAYDPQGLSIFSADYQGVNSTESSGIAVNTDNNGHIFAACTEQNPNYPGYDFTMLEFDYSGTLLHAWSALGVSATRAIIDSTGRSVVLIDDGSGNFVPTRGTALMTFDLAGHVLGALNTDNSQIDNGDGTVTGHAQDVGGLGVDSVGNVYFSLRTEAILYDYFNDVVLSDVQTENFSCDTISLANLWFEQKPFFSLEGDIRSADPAYVFSLSNIDGTRSLVCHDDLGNVRWTQPLPENDFVFRLKVDDYGGVLVYGTTGQTFYVSRFARQGAQIWTQTYAGSGHACLLQDLATKAGIVTVVGDAKSAGQDIALDTVEYQLLAYAVRDDYLTPKNTPITTDASTGVLANDQLASGATAILESPPTNGTLTLNADGSFTYIPNAGYEGYDYAHYHFFKGGFNSNSAIIGFGTGEFLNKHTISPTSVVGGTSTTGTLTLSQPAPAGGFIVNLQSGSSLISVPGSVVVPQGQTIGTYTANTLTTNTTVVRQVIATGGNVTLRVNLTITPPLLQSVDLDASFSHGEAPVKGTVSFGANLSVATQVTLSDDNAATDVPATVTVPKGASSATFTVTTHPVNAVTLSTITASAGSNTVTTDITIEPVKITDFTMTPGFVISGGTTTGDIKIDWPAGAGGTVINLSTNNSSVLSVPLSCTIPNNKTEVTFTATSQSVLVNTNVIVTANNGASVLTALVTVQPNKLNSLSISPSTVPGGVSATGTVGLVAKAATGGVVVNLSANSSILTVPPTMTVPAGSLSGTFSVGTAVVSATYTRTVTATYNGISKIASITVRPPALLNVTVTPSSVVGGQNATGRVNLDGQTAVSITVALSSGSAIIHVPPSVSVPAHASSATFVVGTSAVTQSFTRTVTATYGGVSKSANVTVNPVTLASLTISPSTVVSGNPATGTVTLTGVAPAGGAVISLSSGSSVVHVPATVTVPAGQTHASFTITTSHVSSTVTRTVTATYLGFSKSANITLTP